MLLPEAPVIAAIAEDLPVGVWVAKAPGGELLYANRAFGEIVGVPASSEVVAGTYVPAYAIYDRAGRPYDEARLPFVRALSEKESVVVDDIVIHRPDGSKVNVRAIAKPIAVDGHVSRVVIVFTDITHEVETAGVHRKAEDERSEILAKALRAREEAAVMHERLLDVVNHAPVIIFAADREGRLTLAEGRALHELGIVAEKAKGVSLFDVYRDHPVIQTNIRRALAGESFTDTVEVGQLVFETWYAPLAGPDGGVLGVATDVTERRRMQATLLSAERMVSVGTIAASVAHEINNPLSYVVACLDFLVREGAEVVDLVTRVATRHADDPDTAKLATALGRLVEPFDNIRDGVERMRLIARDLRTFARVDDHELTAVDVRDVLRSAIRMSSNETRYRAMVVTELTEVPWVSASEPRLAQVFLNVLVNAAQAFPEGASPGDCEIRIVTSKTADNHVVISVRDNGSGIEPHILPKIFEPFFTTKPVGVGTGLGLSVCRNILESYGGDISVTSEVGRGSTFVITLPPARASMDRTSSTNVSAPSGAPRSQVKILVIDDDQILGNAFRLTLAQEFSVRVVSSGTQAIEILMVDASFDFIFCDLMMPNLTGMDVFAELSRLRPEIVGKIFFMTGGAYSQEIRQFIARVPNRCLQKPFDPVAVVREALAMSSVKPPSGDG